MFISVTRLRLKGKRMLPSFYFHTITSMIQSRNAEGLEFSLFNKEGWDTYWTLTVWESKEHMMAFRNSGWHLKAMKRSRKMADQLEAVNWESDTLPGWKEGRARLYEKFGKVK
ncbi:DUF3291 domain-containing protein [Virgibacillus xinjiangensis]|uniref:DUF3291 domain-containing protein n=1 Tax=Virgibacillus xinjiangensis TaxID=393090 RepID=A0ABV7CS26_9BACI